MGCGGSLILGNLSSRRSCVVSFCVVPIMLLTGFRGMGMCGFRFVYIILLYGLPHGIVCVVKFPNVCESAFFNSCLYFFCCSRFWARSF